MQYRNRHQEKAQIAKERLMLWTKPPWRASVRFFVVTSSWVSGSRGRLFSIWMAQSSSTY